MEKSLEKMRRCSLCHPSKALYGCLTCVLPTGTTAPSRWPVRAAGSCPHPAKSASTPQRSRGSAASPAAVSRCCATACRAGRRASTCKVRRGKKGRDRSEGRVSICLSDGRGRQSLPVRSAGEKGDTQIHRLVKRRGVDVLGVGPRVRDDGAVRVRVAEVACADRRAGSAIEDRKKEAEETYRRPRTSLSRSRSGRRCGCAS